MANDVSVGVNLLTCSLAQDPLHYQSMTYALRSLLDSDLLGSDWRLVVVDNASTCERTVRYLQELEASNGRVQVEWADTNLGITHGRNRGYQLLQKWHSPEYVIEIHTDHLFPHEWLQPLLAYMAAPRNERVGIVGPALATSQGYWWTPKPRLPYLAGPHTLQDYEAFRAEVEALGLALGRPGHARPGLSHPAVKRWAMVEEIGHRVDGQLFPYDPAMPGRQNFEDIEEAFRAHQSGWQVMIYFGSLVYHHYHLTRLNLSDHPADYDANNAYCQRKHGPDFVRFATTTVGGWMETAYRR